MNIINKLLILLILIFTPLISETNAVYLDTETSTGNTLTAGCWAAPTVPTLLSPADNAYTNAADILLDWSDSGFVCPGKTVEYLYELNGVESVWQSASEVTIFSVSEGDYSWRVKARDSQGYGSAFSDKKTFTIDRTAPATTLSFNGKTINEKVLNGGFESGIANWDRQGQVVIQGADAYTGPNSGAYMVRIGDTSDDGREIWENRLSQKLQPGAKNLSFYYNFFSYDSFNDDPGMVVRLNDYNVFYLSAGEIENFDSPNFSGWTQLSFDISQIPDPVLEIIFYSGNTEDEFDQSWVYIDDISTAEAVADASTNFSLTVNEVAQTYYSLDGSYPTIPGNSFNLNTLIGDTVNYYSLDLAGNAESINSRRVVKDIDPPAAINDLEALATSKQTVNLTWTVPADTTIYDLRYSLNPITEDNFLTADKVLNPPAPRLAGEFQSFTVSGLDSNTTYYFAIKSADAALNWSDISNLSSDTTLDPTDPLSDPDINPGDVVINELMWMGTSGSADDQYLELRNMTDREIDLSGWSVANVTIPLGKTILPHGYFLISHYDQAGSKINVSPDLVDSSLVLNNLDAQYILQDAAANIIDTADNGEGTPAAGQSGIDIYYSMERDATPGKGYNADVWHTCDVNPSVISSYWDVGFVEKGTPGAANLSQSVPIIPHSEPSPQPIFESSPEPTPEPILIPQPEIATESASPSASLEPSPVPDLPIPEPIIIEEVLDEIVEQN